MNCKNQLQEYCQKNNFPLPTYLTTDHQINTKENSNLFKCSVTCFDNITIESEYRTTKKEAHIDAARKMLNYISSNSKSSSNSSSVNYSKYIPPNDVSHIILFDIENRPKLVNLNYKKNVHKIGFMAQYSNHVEKEEELRQYCDLRVIDSAANNAADIALVFYAGRLLQSIYDIPNNRPDIIIVTRDKFGGPLQKLLQDGGTRTHIAVTENDLKKLDVLK